MKTDLFQSCGHCWVLQICWYIEWSTFTASSFRIWNSSTGISSPPLALFIVMLSKAHLNSHSLDYKFLSVGTLFCFVFFLSFSLTPALGKMLCLFLTTLFDFYSDLSVIEKPLQFCPQIQKGANLQFLWKIKKNRGNIKSVQSRSSFLFYVFWWSGKKCHWQVMMPGICTLGDSPLSWIIFSGNSNQVENLSP